jgi:hypothetical protein
VQRRDEVRTHHRGEKLCDGEQPFCICETRDGYKIAKERPYAIEQLRVCTLLTNCYVCMNGDVAGSDNTFGLSPPMLSEYLRL